MKFIHFSFLTLLCFFLSACDYLTKPYAANNVFNEPQVIALAEATSQGDIKTINALIEAGVNVETIGKDNLTPLYWSYAYVSPSPAAKVGFEHLLKKGANPMHVHEPSGLPLLHMVARGDDSDYLELLLKNRKDIQIDYKADDWLSPTAIANAMEARRFKNFKLLIEAGSDMNGKYYGDRTILEKANSPGTWKYALYLLQRGADFNVGKQINDNQTKGSPDIVLALENLNYWNYDGTTDRDKVVEFLLEKGVEVYPYHKEDDPRYNPRPESKNPSKALAKIWENCEMIFTDLDTMEVKQSYNDINLYRDISPDNYSIEGDSILGLAVINLKKYQIPEPDTLISAEFFGRDQDLYSHYWFTEDNLQCVLSTQDLYNGFKSQESGAQIKTTNLNRYVLYNDYCFENKGNHAFEKLESDVCQNIKTDAQTYVTFVE